MMRILDSLCLRGVGVLEDRTGYGERFLFAIDGATGLAGGALPGWDSSAAWLAERLRQELMAHLPEEERKLEDILCAAADTLRAEFPALWDGAAPPGREDWPSAGLALFRRRGETLEYLGLGDCVGVSELHGGKIEVLADGALGRLDAIALRCMAALAEERGCTVLETRPLVTELLREHRAMRNRPGGYWIFDPTGEGVGHALRRSWPVGAVRSLSVMTDGFAQLAEPFRLAADIPALHGMMLRRGLAPLAEELMAAQEADAGCTRYPRFKLRDDMAAVIAAIEYNLSTSESG